MNRLIRSFSAFFILLSPMLFAEEEKSHEILVEVKIKCPMSDEFKEFARSIPEASVQTVSYEEWKTSFINSMFQLINLVESEKITDANWTAKTDSGEN